MPKSSAPPLKPTIGCDKFAAYRTLPSFQEYLLIDIDQYRLHLEHYVKQADNRWLFSGYNAPGDAVPLAAVPAELVLADLYENVTL